LAMDLSEDVGIMELMNVAKITWVTLGFLVTSQMETFAGGTCWVYNHSCKVASRLCECKFCNICPLKFGGGRMCRFDRNQEERSFCRFAL
jgi:hypothetical protein